MYICVCNAVTDTQINEAIDEGARTLEQLQEKFPINDCCGQCFEPVKDHLVKVCTHKQ